MRDQFVTFMPLILSAITLWMTVLAGNLHPRAWLVGLVAQVGWLVWIVVSGAWGFLPMNLGMWWVYGRNHLKWNHSRLDGFKRDADARSSWTGAAK